MAEGRSRVWVWFLVGGGLFFVFVVAVFTLVYFSFGGHDEESFSGFGSKIGVVELDGVIVTPKQVVKQLKAFADDDSIKAIVIHVNSPGGGRGRVRGDLPGSKAHPRRKEKEDRGLN